MASGQEAELKVDKVFVILLSEAATALVTALARTQLASTKTCDPRHSKPRTAIGGRCCKGRTVCFWRRLKLEFT